MSTNLTHFPDDSPQQAFYPDRDTGARKPKRIAKFVCMEHVQTFTIKRIEYETSLGSDPKESPGFSQTPALIWVHCTECGDRLFRFFDDSISRTDHPIAIHSLSGQEVAAKSVQHMYEQAERAMLDAQQRCSWLKQFLSVAASK